MKNYFKLIVLIFSGFLFGQSYSLEKCVQTALENKVTMESARLEVTSAEATKRAALSGVLPSLTFSGSTSDATSVISGVSSHSGSWDSGFSLSQTLYDGGNSWRTLTLGKNTIFIARESERQAMNTVILAVHRAYFQLLKDQHLLESRQEDLDLAGQQMELVQHQFELGAVKKTDVLKAQVRLGQAQTSVITQKSAVDNSTRELANAMGILSAGTPFVINDVDPSLPETPDLDSSLKLMDENNPSLLIQNFTVKNQELSYKNSKGSRLPALTLSGSYGTIADKASDLIGNYSDTYTMSGQLSLSYPLFTGFQSSVRTQQAKINWQTAKNTRTNVRDDLVVQCRYLLDGLRNYKEIIPVLEEVLLAAEEDLKLAQERYALGANTILEVLDAQLSVTQARTDLINTTYDALTQDATLKATLGILDTEFK